MRARGRLIPEVARARELLALVRSGAVDGLSIGFRTVKGRIDPQTRVRRLLDLDLWEISIVTFPLLNGAHFRREERASSRSRARAPGRWRAMGASGPVMESPKRDSAGGPANDSAHHCCADARNHRDILRQSIGWKASAEKRWLRHGAHLFDPSGTHALKSYAARLVEQQAKRSRPRSMQSRHGAMNSRNYAGWRKICASNSPCVPAALQVCRINHVCPPETPKADGEPGGTHRTGADNSARGDAVGSDSTLDQSPRSKVRLAAMSGRTGGRSSGQKDLFGGGGECTVTSCQTRRPGPEFTVRGGRYSA